MKHAVRLFGCLCLAAAMVSAQPVISAGGIVNAASYANASLPNAGVAQGALFTIFGTQMGPSASPSLAFPLQTTLGGVAIAVSQGSTTVAAVPLYVSATQVNAIMPSNAPLGMNSVTLTYLGQPSAVVTVQVVTSSFGIFTVNSSGGGAGIFTNPTLLTTYASSAHAGDTVVIWGTGLGGITGGDVNAPPVGNITANSPSIYVGGVQVAPAYHGRSGCCSGLDEISFVVPPNVAGCSVPVAVQIGNTVSNFVSIAVAAGGNTCSDPSGFGGTQLAELASKGVASVGTVFLQNYNVTNPGFNLLGGGNNHTIGTQQLAAFSRYQFTDLTAIAPVLNMGACSVYSFSGASTSAPGVIETTGLDAGPAITVAGGGSQGSLLPFSGETGFYSARLNLPAGSYVFTGPSGKDVGAFTVTLPISGQTLNWTNEAAITTVQRSNGVNVTWTGADPAGTVQITGFSVAGTATGNAAGAGFTCTAPGSAGQFTVPAGVLLALPPSGNLSTSLLNVSVGSLGISSGGAPVAFTATGLDIGEAFVQATISNSTITYQ